MSGPSSIGDVTCTGCAKTDRRTVACVLLGIPPCCTACTVLTEAQKLVRAERGTRRMRTAS